MPIGIIDRFEGDLAVIEVEGTTLDVQRAQLPDGAKPGDAVQIENDSIVIDEELTHKRKQEIRALMNEVWED